MSMIFSFRVLSDENDNFMRVYDVMYDMSLVDFHRFICRDLRFDDEEVASFFISDSEWERIQEYTLYDMDIVGDGAPQAMDSVSLGQIIHNKRDRLIYRFDPFGDRCLYLELAGCAQADESVRYPCVKESFGATPGQFELLGGEDGSVFDDAMDEFNGIEGDDLYDDEL